MTTLVKVNNLFNQDIQQHVFGDIIKRSVVGELRLERFVRRASRGDLAAESSWPTGGLEVAAIFIEHLDRDAVEERRIELPLTDGVQRGGVEIGMRGGHDWSSLNEPSVPMILQRHQPGNVRVLEMLRVLWLHVFEFGRRPRLPPTAPPAGAFRRPSSTS